MDNINNSSFFFHTKLSLLQKICIAGLFTALIIILQKVLAINYIPVIPFVRISFGAIGLIIVSSILLGPIFGFLVGGLSDILGYFIFDPKTLGFFPSITAIYLLLGLASYFIFCLIKFIKNYKLVILIEYTCFAAILTFITVYLGLNSKIILYGITYDIMLWQKIVIPIILLVLFICLIIINHFLNKRFNKMNRIIALSIYHVSFLSFILEILVMILFGSLMKAIAFGFQTYLAILLCQCIVAFLDIPLNTIIVSYALLITKKYYN